MTAEPDPARVEAVAREMYEAVRGARPMLDPEYCTPWAQALALTRERHLALARWHLAEVERAVLQARVDAKISAEAKAALAEMDSAIANEATAEAAHQVAAAREDIRALAAVVGGHISGHSSDADSWVCGTCRVADAALARPGVKAATEGR